MCKRNWAKTKHQESQPPDIRCKPKLRLQRWICQFWDPMRGNWSICAHRASGDCLWQTQFHLRTWGPVDFALQVCNTYPMSRNITNYQTKMTPKTGDRRQPRSFFISLPNILLHPTSAASHQAAAVPARHVIHEIDEVGLQRWLWLGFWKGDVDNVGKQHVLRNWGLAEVEESLSLKNAHIIRLGPVS